MKIKTNSKGLKIKNFDKQTLFLIIFALLAKLSVERVSPKHLQKNSQGKVTVKLNDNCLGTVAATENRQTSNTEYWGMGFGYFNGEKNIIDGWLDKKFHLLC